MKGLESLKQQYVTRAVVGQKIRSFPVECERSVDCGGVTIGSVDELVDEGNPFHVVIRDIGRFDPVCKECKSHYQGSLARVSACAYGWDGPEIGARNDEWIEPEAAEPGSNLSLPANDFPTSHFVFGDYITCPDCGEKSLWSKSINTIGPCFFECPECHYRMDADPPSEWETESELETSGTGLSDDVKHFRSGEELRD